MRVTGRAPVAVLVAVALAAVPAAEAAAPVHGPAGTPALATAAVGASAPAPAAPVVAVRLPAVAVGAAAVAPTDAAGRAKADELRRAARDALARRDDGEVDLDGSLLGVGGVVWRVLLLVLLALAVLVGVALVRRGPRGRRADDEGAPVAVDGADELERLALRAEEQGAHREAVVLWFAAGARRLAGRPGTGVATATATAGQVARASGDPRVAALAVDHDRAAYGPGPVGPDASRGAREGWRAVLRGPAR